MFTQSSVASVAALKISSLCSRMICPCFSICFLVFQKRGVGCLDDVLPDALTPCFVSLSGSTAWHPHAALRQDLMQHFVRQGGESGEQTLRRITAKTRSENAAKMRSGFGYLIKYLCFSRKCIGAIIYFRKMKQDYLIFITFVFLKKEAKWMKSGMKYVLS